MKSSNSIGKVVMYTILILGAIVMIVPFIWMILTSGKTLTESTLIPPVIFPEEFRFENYTRVWNQLPFLAFYINTFLMILGRVIGSVMFSAMAAFAMAKLNFPGKRLFMIIVLTQLMIPPQVFLTPQYLIAQSLGILNSVGALIMPGIVSAFGTFLLRQHFMSLPDELGESAYMDGASVWTVFYKIYLPLAKSGITALAIFTALFAYRDLLWPLIANRSLTELPLSAGLANLQGQFSTNYPELMAGSVLAIIPMVILFLVFQKQFTQGIATTGGK